jgi:hypothetical protein
MMVCGRRGRGATTTNGPRGRPPWDGPVGKEPNGSFWKPHSRPEARSGPAHSRSAANRHPEGPPCRPPTLSPRPPSRWP